MLYFRITVAPIPFASEERETGNHVAHVFTDGAIDLAASFVAKKMQASQWRIVHVLNARPVHEGERFRHDERLALALCQAENCGFAFFVEDQRGTPERVDERESTSAPEPFSPIQEHREDAWSLLAQGRGFGFGQS